MIGFINNEESQVIPENPPFRDFPTLLNSELQENLKTYLHSFDEIGSNSDDHLHDYYKALGSSSTATRERYGKLDKGQFIFSNPQDWSLGHFFNLYDDLPRIDQNAYMDTEEFTRLLKERELRQKIVDLEVIDQLDNRPFLFTEQEDIKDQYIFSQRKDDTYKLVFLNYGGTGRLASVTFCIGQENDQTNAIRSIEVSFLNKRVYGIADTKLIQEKGKDGKWTTQGLKYDSNGRITHIVEDFPSLKRPTEIGWVKSNDSYPTENLIKLLPPEKGLQKLIHSRNQ